MSLLPGVPSISPLISAAAVLASTPSAANHRISPTTSFQRAKQIIKDSHDMVYYISMLSTTGGKLKVSAKKILFNYNKLRKINPNIVLYFHNNPLDMKLAKTSNSAEFFHSSANIDSLGSSFSLNFAIFEWFFALKRGHLLKKNVLKIEFFFTEIAIEI